MELFTTSIMRATVKPVVPTEWDGDVHGEDKVSGYCESCSGFDTLHNLVLFHDSANPRGEHVLAHETCKASMPGYEYCTCQ